MATNHKPNPSDLASGELPPSFPNEALERVNAIREQLERLGIKQAGYQIARRSRRRIHLGDSQEDDPDSRAIHLTPHR